MAPTCVGWHCGRLEVQAFPHWLHQWRDIQSDTPDRFVAILVSHEDGASWAAAVAMSGLELCESADGHFSYWLPNRHVGRPMGHAETIPSGTPAADWPGQRRTCGSKPSAPRRAVGRSEVPSMPAELGSGYCGPTEVNVNG